MFDTFLETICKKDDWKWLF